MRRVHTVSRVTHDGVDLGRQAVEDLALATNIPVNIMVTARSRAYRAACARTVHDCGALRGRPLVAVHVQSAPAGNRVGWSEDVDEWFHRAAGGTLFIDPVGDLSAPAQGRLLSLLLERLRHSGDTTTLDVGDRHVRVIAGSDRSLSADLAAGAFNVALFYQLNVIHIARCDLTNCRIDDS